MLGQPADQPRHYPEVVEAVSDAIPEMSRQGAKPAVVDVVLPGQCPRRLVVARTVSAEPLDQTSLRSAAGSGEVQRRILSVAVTLEEKAFEARVLVLAVRPR